MFLSITLKLLRNALYVGCLRHFVHSKFRIFRMIFFVSYTIRKWPKFREIIRNFSMQIYTKFGGISRNSVTCYTNFFNESAQTTFFTHSRETSRRCLGVGEYDSTTLNPYPFTAAAATPSCPSYICILACFHPTQGRR
jgi:hypothetical protein